MPKRERNDANNVVEESKDDQNIDIVVPQPKRMDVGGCKFTFFEGEDKVLMRAAAERYLQRAARDFDPTVDELRRLGVNGKVVNDIREEIEALRQKTLGLLGSVDRQIEALRNFQNQLNSLNEQAISKHLNSACDYYVKLDKQVTELKDEIMNLEKRITAPVIKQRLQGLIDQITTKIFAEGFAKFIEQIPKRKRPSLAALGEAAQNVYLK